MQKPLQQDIKTKGSFLLKYCKLLRWLNHWFPILIWQKCWFPMTWSHLFNQQLEGWPCFFPPEIASEWGSCGGGAGLPRNWIEKSFELNELVKEYPRRRWQWATLEIKTAETQGPWKPIDLLLMVQKSGDHQLRLVGSYPVILQCSMYSRWCRISSINRIAAI